MYSCNVVEWRRACVTLAINGTPEQKRSILINRRDICHIQSVNGLHLIPKLLQIAKFQRPSSAPSHHPPSSYVINMELGVGGSSGFGNRMRG